MSEYLLLTCLHFHNTNCWCYWLIAVFLILKPQQVLQMIHFHEELSAVTSMSYWYFRRVLVGNWILCALEKVLLILFLITFSDSFCPLLLSSVFIKENIELGGKLINFFVKVSFKDFCRYLTVSDLLLHNQLSCVFMSWYLTSQENRTFICANGLIEGLYTMPKVLIGL